MDKFYECTEMMKRIFVELEQEQQVEALEIMEHTLNDMSFSYEEKYIGNSSNSSQQYLVQNAEEMISTQLSEDWQNIPSTSEHYFPTIKNEVVSHPMPVKTEVTTFENEQESLPLVQTENFHFEEQPCPDSLFPMNFEQERFFEDDIPLKAFKCGSCEYSANNRKTLYRHRKKTGHAMHIRMIKMVNRGRVVRTRTRKSVPPPNAPMVPPPVAPENIHLNKIDIDGEKNNVEKFEPVEYCTKMINVDDAKQYEDANETIEFVTNSEKKLVGERKTCFECGASFGSRKSLYRHGLKTDHKTYEKRKPASTGGPVKCTLCLYSTSCLPYLKRHMHRQHGIYEQSDISTN